MEKKKGIREIYTTLQAREDWGIADVETSVTNSQTTRENVTLESNPNGVNRKRTAATALSARTHSNPWRYYLPHREPHSWMDRTGGLLKKETGAGNHRSRNIMRIRNLTRTGIILALGTERLYLEPTRRSPAIVRWTQNQIGITCSHFEFGAAHECLQVPILEDIAADYRRVATVVGAFT